MINPAITYRKKMDSLNNNIITDAIKWDRLYKESQQKCTHEDKQGNSTWTDLNEKFIYCSVCEMIRKT